MTVLLDTHAFLWFGESDSRLPAIAKEVIEDSANTAFISPASYWELAIKIAQRKYEIVGLTYGQFWRDSIEKSGVQVLPIELHHCSRLISLPLHHKDPFDRMLVAQSLAEGLPLVSGDAGLDAYGIERIW